MNNNFNHVVSRRELLYGSFALGLSTFIKSLKNHNKSEKITNENYYINFNSIKTNTFDTVTVPNGFSWKVLARWGDPLWSDVPEFNQLTRGNGKSQEGSIGSNNDGMEFFEINGHSLIAVNNEYCDNKIIFGNKSSKRATTNDDVRKSMAAHGISIFEIKKNKDNWSIKKDSYFNRRITPNTPIEITGPASGYHLLKTEKDPYAKIIQGTFNNCGSGKTPWGTYLSCEENFNGYFSKNSNLDIKISEEKKRYGISSKNIWPYQKWSNFEDRFDISKEPNESNRFGYIVEVDPRKPSSLPKKHTAMGRFKHENCEIVISKDKHVVAYMGDDESGEYLYKFISNGKFKEGSPSNYDLLASGKLYVAIFNDDGSGKWVDLSNSGLTKEDICIFSRIAASKVGATKMDRPEWVASNPNKPEVYCALTNNKYRGINQKRQPLNAPNPRKRNLYGQIIRWTPEEGNHSAENFTWDLFLLAGNPNVKEGLEAGSKNITPKNIFNSPDCISFDSLGNLWIQTDGNYSNKGNYKGMGNNQMLIANTITGEIKRFLVGPKECEITGICWSSDKKSMFVGIQHPGEKNPNYCHFPDGGNSIPRSSIIYIYKDNGDRIG